MKKISICIILFFVMVILNTLAVVIPLGGSTTQELSDMYPNLFVPAGITFSIWSVIYTLLLVGVIQQFTRSLKKQEGILSDNLIVVLCINFILNGIWIITWQYQFVELSLLIMVLLLISLIYLATKMYEENFGIINHAINIYLGWISVATIANTTAVLVKNNWGSFGISPTIWTVVILGVATLLGLLAIYKKNNYLYTLVIVWAFIGIFIKQQNNNNTVVYAAIVFNALLVLAMIVNFIRQKRTIDNNHN